MCPDTRARSRYHFPMMQLAITRKVEGSLQTLDDPMIFLSIPLKLLSLELLLSWQEICKLPLFLPVPSMVAPI